MPHFIAPKETIDYLASTDYHNKTGGAELAALLQSMDWRLDTWRTRGTEESDIIVEGGTVPPGTGKLYSSGTFKTSELALADIGKVYQIITVDEGLFFEIVQYSAFVALPNSGNPKYSDLVPDYIRNHQGGEPPADLMWSEWLDGNHPHVVDGSDNLVTMNSNTGNKDTIGSSLLALLNESPAYDVQGQDQYPVLG